MLRCTTLSAIEWWQGQNGVTREVSPSRDDYSIAYYNVYVKVI